jgi:hypothetical protein
MADEICLITQDGIPVEVIEDGVSRPPRWKSNRKILLWLARNGFKSVSSTPLGDGKLKHTFRKMP